MNALTCVADSLPKQTNLVVAFASLEGDMVDQHFGSAQGFFVFDVSETRSMPLISKAFPKEKKDGNEDKLKPKLAWLVGCDIVYCGSIGASATRQLVSLGVTPVKVTGGPDVDDLLQELQLKLHDQSEFWLNNIVRKKQKIAANASSETASFADCEPESWD